MRPLVAEDEARLSRLVGRGSTEAGHAVDLAASGREAPDRIAVAIYDAIVLDLMLPGIDRLEVCRPRRSVVTCGAAGLPKPPPARPAPTSPRPSACYHPPMASATMTGIRPLAVVRTVAARPVLAHRWRRLPFLFVALSLLLVPVEYRAGADHPHPHASAQLWWDDAHGAHHHPADGHAHGPAAPGHGPTLPSAAPEPSDPAVVMQLAPVVERVVVFAAVAAVAALVWLVGHLPAWPASPVLPGLRPRPETPPPRLAPRLAA